MAPLVVVDSGILLASVLEESFTRKAKARLKAWSNDEVELNAPVLFRYELVAVMRKSVSRKVMTVEAAQEALELLLRYGVVFHIDEMLLKRAYEFATQFNRPTAYDSQYLAVAERLACEFWTADERLFNAVTNQLRWVKWLGNFDDGFASA